MKLKSVSIQEIVSGNFSIWSDHETEVGLIEVWPSTRARGSLVVSLHDRRRAAIEWSTDNTVIRMNARVSFRDHVLEGERTPLLVEQQQARYSTTTEWIVAVGEDAIDLLGNHFEEQEDAAQKMLDAIEQLKTFARENPSVAKQLFREELKGFVK